MRKQKVEADLAINEIDRETSKVGTTGHDEVKFRKRKLELEDEAEGAERKIRRYNARIKIVEVAKTRNPA